MSVSPAFQRRRWENQDFKVIVGQPGLHETLVSKGKNVKQIRFYMIVWYNTFNVLYFWIDKMLISPLSVCFSNCGFWSMWNSLFSLKNIFIYSLAVSHEFTEFSLSLYYVSIRYYGCELIRAAIISHLVPSQDSGYQSWSRLRFAMNE